MTARYEGGGRDRIFSCTTSENIILLLGCCTQERL